MKATEIKKELKALGFNVSAMSVRVSSGSLNIYLKDYSNSAEKIREALSKYQSVSRCEATGEILSGGNFFVFAQYDCGADSDDHEKHVHLAQDAFNFSEKDPEHARRYHVCRELVTRPGYEHLTASDVSGLVCKFLKREKGAF